MTRTRTDGDPAPLVIFDIGATLVQGPTAGPARRLAEVLGLGASDRGMLHRALMTTPFKNAAEVAALIRRNWNVSGPEIERVTAEIWARQEREAAPLPGATNAFDNLATHGFQIGLVSDIWPPYLTAVRRHFGALFDTYIHPTRQQFSFRNGHAKPSLEPYRAVLHAAGVPARRALMIGDTYANDMAPAIALGMRSAWLLHQPERSVHSVARVINGEAEPPSLTLTSIAELNVATVAALLRE